MHSGNPDPANDLRLILEKKRSQPGLNCEIVSEASRWLQSELKGAEIDYTYLSCDDHLHYGYSLFLVNRTVASHQMTLSIKIAEIDEQPHVACDIRVSGATGYNAFPLYTQVTTHEGQQLLLAYIADFVLSCEDGQAG